MIKKKKKINFIILASFISIFVLFVGFMLVSQTIIGVTNELDYTTEWHNQDLTTGNYVTEATLDLPEGTTIFSFTPDYRFETYNRNSNDVSIDVKYEVFNYGSNSLEVIEDKSWNLKNDYGEQNKFRMDGETVYNTGIPEHLESNRVEKYGYERFYGCLDGMNINEAKALNPWTEGTRSYSYKCLYPGNSISKHEYGDDSDEDWDIEYFPHLITLDSNYIKDNKVLFKISVNVKSSGIDSIHYKDFGIDLWELETTIIDTYSYSELEEICVYQSKYTYQVTDSDYFTRNECNYQNLVIECYEDSHCFCEGELIPECQGWECVCEKETILDIIFPGKDDEEVEIDIVLPDKDNDEEIDIVLPDKDNDEEIDIVLPDDEEPVIEKSKRNLLGFIIPIVILILIGLIVRNIIKKKNK